MGSELTAGKRPNHLGIDPGCVQRFDGQINLRYDYRPPFGCPPVQQVIQTSVASSNGAHLSSLSNQQRRLRQPDRVLSSRFQTVG